MQFRRRGKNVLTWCVHFVMERRLGEINTIFSSLQQSCGRWLVVAGWMRAASLTLVIRQVCDATVWPKRQWCCLRLSPPWKELVFFFIYFPARIFSPLRFERMKNKTVAIARYLCTRIREKQLMVCTVPIPTTALSWFLLLSLFNNLTV